MKKPNVSAHDNTFGGMDVRQLAGATVRTTFEDGQHAIYVFDSRMCMQYDVKMGYTAPDALLNAALRVALASTFGVMGEQREALEIKVHATRKAVVDAWKKAEGI